MVSLDPAASPLMEEKRGNDLFRPDGRLSSRKAGWGLGRLIVILLTVVCGIGLIGHFGNGYIPYLSRPDSGHQTSSEYPPWWTEWSSITPSEKLTWQPCFGIYGPDFLCARLTVPMDYQRPLNQSAANPKVHIALVLKPGINRTEDPSSYSESPLLVNPGGPGGSGAFYVLRAGKLLQTVVGADRDIISFDPRGVGGTTPKADCFAADEDHHGLDGRNIALMNRLSWISTGQSVGLVNSSSAALSMLNTRSRAMARFCKLKDDFEGDDSIYKYANTANVARDMLSIVHAWDEWRSVPDVKPINSKQESESSDETDSDTRIGAVDSTRGKLVYWGFSYGTVLGATFASMFPDKVGRVILDGVVDADSYVGEMMAEAIEDADSIWEKFFVYCAEAGQRCPLYRVGDKPEDVKDRVNYVLDWLQREPAIIIPPPFSMPVVVTASDFKLIIFMSLYAPNVAFGVVSELLKALMDGRLDDFMSSPIPSMLCHNLDLPQWPDDAQKVIACGDKRYKLNEDVPSLQKRFEDLSSSSSFADIWMSIDLSIGCNGWDIEPKGPPMRWDKHPRHAPERMNTSFPLLFLSNDLDPVTPLRSAVKMTNKFHGAGLVVQEAEGHCTIACISLCTINHIRAYLNQGVVPPPPPASGPDAAGKDEWTTCGCEERPWRSFKDAEATSGGLLSGKTAEERETIDAYRKLRNEFVEFTTSQYQFQHRNPLRPVYLGGSGFMDTEQFTYNEL